MIKILKVTLFFYSPIFPGQITSSEYCSNLTQFPAPSVKLKTITLRKISHIFTENVMLLKFLIV